MSRFYVATALERAEDQRKMVAALVTAGHELTYDWAKHGSVQAQPELWADVAEAEERGVSTADFVVVLLPGGRGTHTELGLALGAAVHRSAEKPMTIFVVGDQLDAAGRICIFYAHPFVVRVPVLGPDGDPRSIERIAGEIVEAVK